MTIEEINSNGLLRRRDKISHDTWTKLETLIRIRAAKRKLKLKAQKESRKRNR